MTRENYAVTKIKDANHPAEYGATALAVLLMMQLANYFNFEESSVGTGIDFLDDKD